MDIKGTIRGCWAYAKAQTKNHLPDILLGVAFVLDVAATVTIIKEGRTADKILDEHDDKEAEAVLKAVDDETREKIENLEDGYSVTNAIAKNITNCKEPNGMVTNGLTVTFDKEKYEEVKKELATMRISTIIKLLKHFAPGVALKILQWIFTAYSHHELKYRLAQAVMEAATAQAAYRKLQDQIKSGQITVKEEENHENSEKKEDPNDIGLGLKNRENARMFRFRFWPETCPNTCSKYPAANVRFLKDTEAQLNYSACVKALQSGGRAAIYLDEVLKTVGYDIQDEDERQIAHRYGWVICVNAEDNYWGDNKIKLGWELPNPNNDRFLMGEEYTCMLEFNVDGNLIDDIELVKALNPFAKVGKTA